MANSSSRIALAGALSLVVLLAACSRGANPPSQSGSLLGTGSAGTTEAILSMQADAEAVPAGNDVSYTITVRNQSAEALQSVALDITLPLNKLQVTEAPGGTIGDSRISWTVGELAAGAERTFTFRALLNTGLSEGETVRTVATLRAEGLTPAPTSSAEIRVGTAAGGTALLQSSASSVASTEASSSVNSAYAFFLGETSSVEAFSESSIAAVISSVPSAQSQITLTQFADRTERSPGQRVRYTATIRNASAQPVRDVALSVFFPDTVIPSAPGAEMSGNEATWTIPELNAGELRTYVYTAMLEASLQPGTVVTTVANVSALGAERQAVTTDVHIIARLPQAGAEAQFTAPLDDQSNYLTPISH